MSEYVCNICFKCIFRYLRKGATGMSLMEIGIPSGMTPDYETLDFKKAPEYKRKEELFRKLVLYFDSVSCITLK